MTSDQDVFPPPNQGVGLSALLKQVCEHMRANKLSTSDITAMLERHEKDDLRETLINAAISTDPVPVRFVRESVLSWALLKAEVPVPGNIILSADGDPHEIPISAIATPGKNSRLEVFMAGHPGVYCIGLPKECKFALKHVIELMRGTSSLHSMVAMLTFDMRRQIRATLAYLGLDHLDVAIPVRETEVLSRYGEVSWSTDKIFGNIIYSTGDGPSTPPSDYDRALANTWGRKRVEAFLLNFGRSVVVPELVKIDVVKPNNDNYRLNRFKMWVLSTQLRGGAAEMENLVKRTETSTDTLSVKVPDDWKVLGCAESTQDSGRLSITVNEPVSCQMLTVMFVSPDDQPVNLKVGRFQVLGRGCLRL